MINPYVVVDKGDGRLDVAVAYMGGGQQTFHCRLGVATLLNGWYSFNVETDLTILHFFERYRDAIDFMRCKNGSGRDTKRLDRLHRH